MRSSRSTFKPVNYFLLENISLQKQEITKEGASSPNFESVD